MLGADEGMRTGVQHAKRPLHGRVCIVSAVLVLYVVVGVLPAEHRGVHACHVPQHEQL